MLSGYAKNEWITILVIGLMLSATSVLTGWWWVAIPVVIITCMLLAFFRDPKRQIPADKGVMVSPADGRISSIHEIDDFEPFGGPATCIRIFMSVFDVHVNRSPCHARVVSKTHRPGKHMNVLNPASAEANESCTVVLAHPVQKHPIAVVRQIAGLIARTIVTAPPIETIMQRGQRFGLIKFGSTVELYVPQRLDPVVQVKQGDYVYGGLTILVKVSTPAEPGNEKGTTESQEPESDQFADGLFSQGAQEQEVESGP